MQALLSSATLGELQAAASGSTLQNGANWTEVGEGTSAWVGGGFVARMMAVGAGVGVSTGTKTVTQPVSIKVRTNTDTRVKFPFMCLFLLKGKKDFKSDYSPKLK